MHAVNPHRGHDTSGTIDHLAMIKNVTMNQFPGVIGLLSTQCSGVDQHHVCLSADIQGTHVTAAADRSTVAPETVLTELFASHIPAMASRYPGITFTIAGEAEERAAAFADILRTSLVALMIIFALLAIPLRSYLQPLVVMASIPFRMVGAILGHYVMGYDLVFFSLLGIVALSGVVINSSLVLVDYVNRQRQAGISTIDAVVAAGVTRFRPILLTSVTTFIGLAPLMITADQETMVFVPLAVSLGFGVIFATTVTLLLIPALYVVLQDLVNVSKR